MHKTHHHRAFSLVELSIVLVILGLLIGGILAGKALIKAAELRKAGNDLQRYTASFYSFRDKYFYFPGDLPNATLIWGKDNTACGGQTGTAATPGTCNGNGDGLMPLNGSYAYANGESTRVWQHLALAGLIEGNFPGVSNAVEPWVSGGTNLPIIMKAPIGITVFSYNLPYNLILIGAPNLVNGVYTNTNALYNPAFSPEDAWNIDSKWDDGLPSSGKLQSLNTFDGTVLYCLSGTSYAISTTTPTCYMYSYGLRL